MSVALLVVLDFCQRNPGYVGQAHSRKRVAECVGLLEDRTNAVLKPLAMGVTSTRPHVWEYQNLVTDLVDAGLACVVDAFDG